MSEPVTCVKDTFSIEVEKYAEANDETLLEALVFLAEKFGVSDKINSYISRPLKEKLEIEAIDNNLLKRTVKPQPTLF